MIRLDDAKRGDILYRLGRPQAGGTRFFRPIKVIRTTPKMIVGCTLTGQELRFWREDGYEVGSDRWYYLTLGVIENEKCRLAACDKGRTW